MRIELIFIGNELLRGAVVNTNAAYLGQQIASLGWEVSQQTTIADVPEEIEECLTSALKRADLLLMTGGLGPTVDDRTRAVLAKLFNTELALNEEIYGHLKARYGDQELSLENQATIPRAAKALLNPSGTAPGLILEKKGKLLIALPGVPVEMKALFEGHVRAYLKERYKEQMHQAVESISFFALSESELDPIVRKIETKFPRVDFGIYPSYGVLNLILTSASLDDVVGAKKALIQALPQHHFSSLNGKLEEAIHAWMIAQGKTLALAESCTGGRIAAQLTALPGSSRYLLGSFVTYSNHLKESVLGVSKATIEKYGSVSQETAKEMLQGLFQVTDADYGLAITGLAGPEGGSERLPVGTLFIAVGARGQPPRLEQYYFPGNREKIQLLGS